MLRSAGAYLCCRITHKTSETLVLEEETSNTNVTLQSFKAASAADSLETDCLETDCLETHNLERDKVKKQFKQQHTRSFVYTKNLKEKIMSENKFCDPCSSRNIQAAATHYCQDCDEKYCNNCTESHKNQKATKDHRMIDHIRRKMCDPCHVIHKETTGTYVCEQCEEFLCTVCKKNHILQKQNKDHKVKSIVEEILCEPCHKADRREQATSYCQDCADPEPLCQSCASQHQAMKMTRTHQLSTDIATYILRYKKEVDMNMSENTKSASADQGHGCEEPICEPCNYSTRTRKAVHYCKDCEEMYCNECMIKHNSKKNFSFHDAVKLKDVLKILEICEPCNFNSNEVQATHKCEDCNEYLCGDCKRSHVSSKQQRNHKITPVPSSFLCINCQEPDNAVKATFFCTNCEDLLCEVCADDHVAMKKTRDHQLTPDMVGSVIQKEKRLEASKGSQKDRHECGENHASKLIASKDAQTVAYELHQSCDPCAYSSKTVNANCYCKECDEYLCTDCKEYHGAQKQNKDHTPSELTTMPVWCTSCKNMDKDVMASTFCLECKEPMCHGCAEKHQSMKFSRGHQLDRSHLSQRYLKDIEAQKTENPIESDEQASLQKTEQDICDSLGKPYSLESKSNSTVLQWKTNRALTNDESFQIMYKEAQNGKWKQFHYKKMNNEPRIAVNGLKADTSFIFKVRIVNESTGNEGSYSEESDTIQTKQSPAIGILQNCEKISDKIPYTYRLPIRENVSARNESAQTRKFFLGSDGTDTTERTIMMVGATGSGKSTLINGMANFIMGVNFEDSFRFTLINLEGSEKDRERDQAVSQTEWVTCYTLHKNLSDRVNFTVNLIDTPGFGDTRGLDNDKKIVEQIRQLFISKGEKGVATIDAVCFILKAPDARLTTTQRYIFESVLSLFGNDIKDNICTLITFADGQRPPVLSGIQALDGLPLPFEKYFTFNNSALYVDNTGNSSNSLTPFFWKMGIQSCESFFDHMNNMQTKSLLLTSEVLRKRAKLENTILNLQQEIDVGLSKINVLEKEAEIFRKHAKAILENKNFEYDVDEDIQEKIDLTGKSQYTTNCLICNFTCHESCSYPNDQDKAKCCSMNKDGNCTQCPKGCNWKEHHNTPYIIKWTKRKVKKRYEDMKRKYEEATQQTLTQEQVLEEMNQDIFIQEQGIQVMMEIITKLNNRLKEIALRPDPLSTEQYIDLMIASELREKKSGFDARVAALHKCKQRTKYGESVQIFQDRVANTRRTMAASDVADELIKEDKSVIGWFKNLFKQKK